MAPLLFYKEGLIVVDDLKEYDYAEEYDFQNFLVAYPVLDKGGVRLIMSAGSDLSVVNAARASYGKDVKEMTSKDIGLISFLARERHLSPLRHAFMTFEIKAPLEVARQHFKYIVGSDHVMDGWNEMSGRYVTKHDQFYLPDHDQWRTAPENSKQGSGGPVGHLEGSLLTAALMDVHEKGEELYQWALKLGVAPEQARLFLPAYGLYTFYRWSCSLQSVMHFLNERLASDAQHEITQYAKIIYRMVQPRFPVCTKEFVHFDI